MFDIECKYVKLHASQETLWYAQDPKRGIGTEVPEFFLCFRAIRMTGEKVPDKDIHISLEVLVDYFTPIRACSSGEVLSDKKLYLGSAKD